jgi:hypothetical protein
MSNIAKVFVDAADRLRRFLLIGVDRKWLAEVQLMSFWHVSDVVGLTAVSASGGKAEAAFRARQVR